MIKITEDFYIDRDAYNWIIKQRVTVRNKEKQTEREELQTAGYYSKFKQALRETAHRLFEAEIEASGDMSIGEAIERFENACRGLEDAIDRMEDKDEI